MGITLSGTKPKDTYQSLLKTADNLILDSVLRVISDGSGNDSSLLLSVNRVGISADSSVTTQSVAVIESTSTNAGIVLKPNGTGAIMAQVPDGTAAGGNARGTYAVDLQMTRSAADQVAGYNYDSITGGQNNKISANLDGYRHIGGGYGNTILVAGFSVVAGGRQNSISGGGSSFSTISGGQSNTASTNAHATVVGGYGNTSSGAYSISGGYSNVASGQGSVALGYDVTASGQYSVVIGSLNAANGINAVALGNNNNVGGISAFAVGNSNNSSGTNSSSFGTYTKAYLFGQSALSGGRMQLIGDAQQSLLTSRKVDTLASAATTVLSLDGTGTTNLIIPDGNNRAWNVTVKWVAIVTAANGAAGIIDGDSIASTEQLLFKKVAGTSSVVGSASTLSTHSDASMAGCSMAYTAGASQELALTFTGPTFAAGGPVDCRIVAKVELTEVAW